MVKIIIYAKPYVALYYTVSLYVVTIVISKNLVALSSSLWADHFFLDFVLCSLISHNFVCITKEEKQF